jgi:tetratricopeptide (TPR) repeat protein
MKSILAGLFKSAATTAAPNPADEIEHARKLHQRGDHEAAATIYRAILESHPDNVEAHYRLGNLLKDQGSLAQAVASYDRAISFRADHAHAYCNRAVVLGLLDRLPDALESYDRAIAIDPKDALAQCNRALLLIALGKKDAALAGFEAAIDQDDNNFTSHFARGTLLQERRLLREALAAYDRAIAIQPGEPPVYYNRGTVLKELNDAPAAVASYDKAIALNPHFALAYANRATLLQELNQTPAALADYDQAIALNDHDVATHTNRAVLLQQMGRRAEALAGYDRAVALDPLYADAWFNRGTALSDDDDFQAALDSYEHAVAAKSDFGDAYVNRGVTLQDMGHVERGIESYKRAIEANPNLAEAHYNLALASLTVGDYATGWSEHEWRWQAKSGPIYREKRSFAQPLWVGKENIAGKTIMLYSEQGLGDSLQFCRYVELVARLGARVILEVPSPLTTLCATLPGVSQIIPYGSPLPYFEYQCPLMSLPLAFSTALETIPSASGYLRADAGKVAAWRDRLGAAIKPRIGLTWSGTQAPGKYRKRHFALSTLLPYLSSDFHYYCLQKEITAADNETMANTPWIFQGQDFLKDFSDTAALCECMDLVISVDTSVAHMSSALAKKTWVLLAYAADWRWLLERQDSPWYHTARLFRQTSPGEWNGVFERIATALRSEVIAGSAPPG